MLELGFNRPTWLADSSVCNHESYVLVGRCRLDPQLTPGSPRLLSMLETKNTMHCYQTLLSTATCARPYVLDVILPRVLALHNVGRMSLMGYANGQGVILPYASLPLSQLDLIALAHLMEWDITLVVQLKLSAP